ncbi:MAG: hypothetical protein EBS83_11340, partial [Planctomycetia bacterium]|nr:hypothetical protein [Planctomycetia bacterium]
TRQLPSGTGECQSTGDRPPTLRDLEMQAILAGLERNSGNKSRTAEELGISLKTLYNKLNQYTDAVAAREAA